MICYRDITFCYYLDCKNKECKRRFEGQNIMKTFEVNPIGKPRMNRGSVHSKVAKKYWAYKDAIQLQKRTFELPESDFQVVFVLQMPKSWSNKKKEKMVGQKHQQTPDIDNLAKAFFDALLKEDSHIWDCRLTKVWGCEGAIIINKL